MGQCFQDCRKATPVAPVTCPVWEQVQSPSLVGMVRCSMPQEVTGRHTLNKEDEVNGEEEQFHSRHGCIQSLQWWQRENQGACV